MDIQTLAFQAYDRLIDDIEHGLDLQISKDGNGRKGKTVALASSRWLEEKLRPGILARNLRLVDLAKQLGVDRLGARGRAARQCQVHGRGFCRADC